MKLPAIENTPDDVFLRLEYVSADCTLLADLHGHAKDRFVSFVQESHSYYVEGRKVPLSVTGLVHCFVQEFRADEVIQKMMASHRWPRPEYSHHVGDTVVPFTADEIKQMWSRNAREAAARGTWMHLQVEVLLNAGSVQDEFPVPLIAFRTEWCIYASDEQLAGCIDFVARCSQDEVILFDWKRTKDLCGKYSNRWANMTPPVSHLEDCAGNHYRLQLNLYKHIIEKYYNLKVRAMRVVCLHPDREGRGPFVDHVPVMDKEIHAILEAHSCRLRQSSQDVCGGRCSYGFVARTLRPAELDWRLESNCLTLVPEQHFASSRRLCLICTPVSARTGMRDSYIHDEVGGAMTPEILELLPPYFFSGDFLSTCRCRVCPNQLMDYLGGASSQESFDARILQDIADEMEVATPEEIVPSAAVDADEQPAEADLALAIPCPGLSPEALVSAKKRRLMPGASTSGQDFEALFDLTSEACSSSLSSFPAVDEQQPVASVKELAKKQIEFVRLRQPTWPEDMVRLSAAAINVYRTRLTDIFVRDFVGLIWIIEGERYIRAHRGVCYLYHSEGAFDAYNGVPPESTFYRLKKTLLRLEGCFTLCHLQPSGPTLPSCERLSRCSESTTASQSFC